MNFQYIFGTWDVIISGNCDEEFMIHGSVLWMSLNYPKAMFCQRTGIYFPFQSKISLWRCHQGTPATFPVTRTANFGRSKVSRFALVAMSSSSKVQAEAVPRNTVTIPSGRITIPTRTLTGTTADMGKSCSPVTSTHTFLTVLSSCGLLTKIADPNSFGLTFRPEVTTAIYRAVDPEKS